jgi:hypothetical protein
MKHIQQNAEIKKNIKIYFFRKKIILEYKSNQLTVKCHYQNKSRHYISILKDKREIVSLHDSISPAIMTNIIIALITK